jgi:hypothetical protein
MPLIDDKNFCDDCGELIPNDQKIDGHSRMYCLICNPDTDVQCPRCHKKLCKKEVGTWPGGRCTACNYDVLWYG